MGAHFQSERLLLLYLALLMNFVNGGLPERNCYQFVISTWQPSRKGWRSLSPQSGGFLAAKPQDSRKIVETGNVLEILDVSCTERQEGR